MHPKKNNRTFLPHRFIGYDTRIQMKSLHGMCAQQRVRHAQMVLKRSILHDMLKRMQKTSEHAIILLKDMQTRHEECLSVGCTVCSVVQSSATGCDTDGAVVAASLASIKVAKESVENVGTDVVKLCGIFTVMQESFEDVVGRQQEAHDNLNTMCNTHACAVDVHAPALHALGKDVYVEMDVDAPALYEPEKHVHAQALYTPEKDAHDAQALYTPEKDAHAQALHALEKGLGHQTEASLCCASCMQPAEAVYAARTGMCKLCHEKAAADAVNSGWARCV